MAHDGCEVRLRVRGGYALFTRPEMKCERVSYDVPTPSAMRGVLEAIFWKPQIAWVVDKIHVLQPIRFINIRRNEVAGKIPTAAVKRAMGGDGGRLAFDVDDGDNRQQRAALCLRDVDYLVEAHFVRVRGDEPLPKYYEMFKRRAEKGQAFHQPYLGCREFPADFSYHEGPAPKSPLVGVQDLGWMLHDIDFADGMKPRFFRAKLEDGVLKIPAWDAAEVRS